ncbi:oxidoreductase [Cystoisospora suis]|uniref:Oxidoreductase n=1 Tax=Cystoisospora suis TaxID=483139 RepID=A0A2C6KP11_9APIC|nr:oxidoreductase [Cystoisospora suis]
MARCRLRAWLFHSRAWLFLSVIFPVVCAEKPAEPPSAGVASSSTAPAESSSSVLPGARYQNLSFLDSKAELSPETKAVLDSLLKADNDTLTASSKNETDRSQKSVPSGEGRSSAYSAEYDYGTPIYGPPPPSPSYAPPHVPPSSATPPFVPGWEDSAEHFYYNQQEEYDKARLKYRDAQVIKDKEEFDFIVVGCGCAGCPLASYLALKGEGRRVLVLERGLERTFEQAPMAMTVYGHGMAAADQSLSQPYSTRSGVRTHVPTVMGGGTSTDLAIYVEETENYFNYMNKRYPAYKFHWPTIQRAYRYIRRIIARRMPFDNYFGLRYQQALRWRGYKPVGGDIPAGYSSSLQMDKVWSSFTLFDMNEGGFRRASDVFIDELPDYAKRNIVVRTRHNVEWIEFDLDQSPPRARCVIYRPTAYEDIKPQGTSFASSLPSSSAHWGPWIGTFLAPKTVLLKSGELDASDVFFKKEAKFFRKVCVKDRRGSQIILSAGAINSAVILFRSGVGPVPQLKKINSPVIVEHPTLGQKFSDRVFIPVSGFMKHYADELTPVPFAPVRRLSGLDASSRTTPARSARGPRKGKQQEDDNRDSVEGKKFGGKARRAQREESDADADLSDQASQKEEGHERKISATHLRDELDDEDDDVEAPAEAGPSSPEQDDLEAGTSPARIFLPDLQKPISPELSGKFLDVYFPQKGRLDPPRVCQGLGLKRGGPPHGCDKENYSIGRRTLTCSLMVAEEMSGGRAQEGIIYASRFIFPPLFRNDPLIDAVFEILQACAEYKAPYGVAAFKPLCAIVMPITKCLRKAFASFYFTAEPKSRGSVRLAPNGMVEVNGAYLKDEQDLFDAVRGVSNLIMAMNGDAYKGVVQPAGSFSCPVTILNGLLDLILTIAGTTSIFVTRPGNFALIQKFLQDLLPPNNRRLRRLVAVGDHVKARRLQTADLGDLEEPADYIQEGMNEPNKFVLEDYSEHVVENVDEKKMEELGIKEKLKEAGFDFEAYRKHLDPNEEVDKDMVISDSASWFTSRRLQEQMKDPQLTEREKQTARRLMELQRQREQQYGTDTPVTPDAKPSSETSDVEPPTEGDGRDGTPESDSLAFEVSVEELEEAKALCKKPCDSSENKPCPAADVCCAAFNNALCIRTPDYIELERRLKQELLENSSVSAPLRQARKTDTSGDVRATTSRSEKTTVETEGFLGALPDGLPDLLSFVPSQDSMPPHPILYDKRPPYDFPTYLNPPKPEGFPDPDMFPSAPPPGTPPLDILPYTNNQWAATYPPRLPNPYKPKEVAKYALSYMSSVWHHCNTAPMGEVVNSDFEVIGTKGLSIIDGSVMNQLTRLNPLATLLMFGVYGGMKKLKNAGVKDVLPPLYPEH